MPLGFLLEVEYGERLKPVTPGRKQVMLEKALLLTELGASEAIWSIGVVINISDCRSEDRGFDPHIDRKGLLAQSEEHSPVKREVVGS